MADYKPTVQQCMDQWYHNRALLSRLEPSYNDWIITVTFYAALHAVETLLKADSSTGCATHGSRHGILQGNPRYRTVIWPAYKVAYDLAHVARYSAQPRKWTSSTNIEKLLFDRALYPIETEVARLLSELKPPQTCAPRTPIVLKAVAAPASTPTAPAAASAPAAPAVTPTTGPSL